LFDILAAQPLHRQFVRALRPFFRHRLTLWI
jgi:hypothetical protein